MNALPASSSPELISPLASKLVQFLAQKQAMGYRYRDEGRALRELDRFLISTLAYRQKTRYHAGHCARLRSATGY
jgi:hypothetical protein